MSIQDFKVLYQEMRAMQKAYFADFKEPSTYADLFECDYALKVKEAIIAYHKENMLIDIIIQLPKPPTHFSHTPGDEIVFQLSRSNKLHGYEIYLSNELIGFFCMHKAELFWDDSVNKILQNRVIV